MQICKLGILCFICLSAIVSAVIQLRQQRFRLQKTTAGIGIETKLLTITHNGLWI